MPAILQERVVPDEIYELTPMRPDYVDLFSAEAGGDRSPAELCCRLVEDAAGAGGQFCWRVVLGLRLDGGPDGIGGWTVAEWGEGFVRLEASSWFLTAHVVVRLDAGRVWVATFVRYDHAVARVIWPAVAVVHRRAMPGLIRHAVRP